MNYIIYRLLIFSLLFILFCKKTESIKPIKPGQNFELQGHRGARGLLPENTIPAFQKALELNMNVIELDTILSSDKEILVYHDIFLNSNLCRTQEGKKLEPKPVNHISLQEFKNLDCGSVKNPKFPEQKTIPKTHPPDLEEVFSFITSYERKNPEAKKVYLNIEIKANPHDMTDKDLYFHADKIITLAEKYSLKDRITIQSFEHIVLTYIKEKYPSVKTSALFSMTYFQFFRSKLGWIKGLQKEVIEKSITLKVDYISPFYAYVNPDFVKACHEKGLKLIPWTINSEEHIEEIMSYGVDGIISDYPDRLYRVWKKLSESSL